MASKWPWILEKYTRLAGRHGGRFMRMNELVEHIAAQPVAKEIFPNASHHSLILTLQDSDFVYFPAVQITSIDHEAFEVTLLLGNRKKVTTITGNDAFHQLDEIIDTCISQTKAGPARGSPLKCDIVSLLIEARIRSDQVRLIILDQSGAAKIKGDITHPTLTQDLFIFNIHPSIFDICICKADGEWLNRAGVYGRHMGRPLCMLNVGFRLIDGTERMLSFVSHESTFDCPADIRDYVDGVVDRLKPFINAEVGRVLDSRGS